MLAVIPLVSLTDRRPARQLYLASSTLSALSCFGMALCDPFSLAILIKFLQREGAGRVEQPEPRFGATDIRDDQRFRHQIDQEVDRIGA